MKSIGNDIVALRYIDEQRTHLPAFYSKFIAAGELQLHPAVMPLTQFVWLSWAVKESAYKYLKRSEADLLYSPTKLLAQKITLAGDTCSGQVQFRDQILYFLAKIQPEYIVAIVNDTPNFDDIHWGVKQIDSDDTESQSKEVRILTLDKLKSIFPGTDVHITKAEVGYPIVVKNNIALDVPLSFAHHGNYVTYAFRAD